MTSTETTAKISVITSVPAVTELFYGTTASYGSTTLQSPALTTSYFNLAGLIPNKLYYLKAVSLAGGQTVSAGITFTPGASMAAPTSTLPPFTRNLTIGSTGADVLELQQLLNQWGYTIATSGPGSPGNETMHFGGLTAKAVQKFQAAEGISPVSGFVGPLTRAKLNALIGATTVVAAPAAVTGVITTSLALGSSGAQVTALQTILTKDGDYTGPITGYFGALTEAAVEKFQAAQGIVSYGSPDTTGYGAVGPKTRGALGGE